MGGEQEDRDRGREFQIETHQAGSRDTNSPDRYRPQSDAAECGDPLRRRRGVIPIDQWRRVTGGGPGD